MKKNAPEITIVDHFCGAGGESTGIMKACEDLGLGVTLHAHNHWIKAVQTHKYNHPEAIHRCEAIERIDPVAAVPTGRVALMWASPECTHHSVARGGRPCSDQSRATAMHVIKWLQELYVDRLIVENVPEFLNWGPIGVNGQPLKSKKGQTFKAWVGMIKSLGYTVDWKILRAADFGDPTTRRRLFIQAVRGNKKIVWPEPTHAEENWIPAREIIDWNIPGQSIFDRKKPLAKATMRRIEAGIERFWGDWAEPFLCVLRGTGNVRAVDLPLPAVTAGGQHLGLVQPFMSKFHGGDPNRNHSIDGPVPTLDTSNRVGLVEPFMLPQHSCGAPRGVDSSPVSTVATAGAISLIDGVADPFVLTNGHRSSIRVRPVDKPLSTCVTKAEHCLVEPLVMEYYGNGGVKPASLPLGTCTTKDRFMLIQGVPYQLDIRFRMLQPHELAAAQGFPSDYWFSGTKADQVKQIGNAVPVNLARAIAREVLAA